MTMEEKKKEEQDNGGYRQMRQMPEDRKMNENEDDNEKYEGR